jgi:hypothetical protein
MIFLPVQLTMTSPGPSSVSKRASEKDNRMEVFVIIICKVILLSSVSPPRDADDLSASSADDDQSRSLPF